MSGHRATILSILVIVSVIRETTEKNGKVLEKLLGSRSQLIIIEHYGIYYKVHTCRVMLEKEQFKKKRQRMVWRNPRAKVK